MKAALAACVLLGLTAQAFGENFDNGMVEEQSGRLFFFNSSSTATTLTIVGSIILLGVIAYLVYASGLLGVSAYNRNDYYQYNQYEQGAYDGAYSEYRSAKGSEFNGVSILEWISMFQDLYENFDYNDIDCQKRLICEVMREPEYYGTVARKVKNGMQYARYLEVLQLPDEFRNILDEYLDANARSDDNKECEEFFTCPYSLKDSIKKNVAITNNL